MAKMLASLALLCCLVHTCFGYATLYDMEKSMNGKIDAIII
jgi:hypothetical protein